MRAFSRWSPSLSLVALLAISTSAHAESGRAAWLRYAPLPDDVRARYMALPRIVVRLDDSLVVRTASNELASGLDAMLGGTTSAASRLDRRPMVVLGTLGRVRAVVRGAGIPAALPPDAFWIGSVGTGAQRRVIIA